MTNNTQIRVTTWREIEKKGKSLCIHTEKGILTKTCFLTWPLN